MALDYLASIEEKRDAKELPRLRTFFKVNGLPYEIHDHDVTTIVSELIHLGAISIVIERVIIDDNNPPPETVEPEKAVGPEEYAAMLDSAAGSQ